jgi:hypothetical protein
MYFDNVGQRQVKSKAAFQPTKAQRELVMRAAGLGLPQTQIAMLVLNPKTSVPISPDTLMVAFRDELDIGIAKANLAIMGNLFRLSFTHPAAGIFLARVRLGLIEPKEESPVPKATSDYTSLEVARRVAFVLNAAARGVQLSQYGPLVGHTQSKEGLVIDATPD